MKSDILKCLGNFPKKTNLNIVQISNIEYKEYNEILVDKNNIGAIGHSLGGQESIWLSWFDERIKCCISSCGNSCIKDIEDYEVVQNFAFYVPNLNNICDIDEIINEIAPRAILLTNGLKDERHCPLSGIDRIEEKNKNNINFKLIKFDDDHKFNNSEKIIAYNFLDRYLK